MELIGRAVANKPDYAEAHNSRANILTELGRLEDAVESYRKALDLHPGFAHARNNLGVALRELGRSQDACGCYREALARRPDYPEAHYNLGNALKDLGKVTEAAESYRWALVYRPDYTEAHRRLADVRTHGEYDHEIQAMEDLFAKDGLSDQQRMYLAFGLGKAYDDLGETDKAFGFLAEGNAIKKATLDYSRGEQESLFAATMRNFDAGLFSRLDGGGVQGESPIFIVGLPRSGTTLVEQILASHPGVRAGGELDTLSRVIATAFGLVTDGDFVDGLNKAAGREFERAGREYLTLARQRTGEGGTFTDKMPDNFRHIGMIKLMLPDARVIHCRRGAQDTCWSLFKTYFTGPGHGYAYDLAELAPYFKLYEDLMAHWHAVLPGFVYDIAYEDLVANQEGRTRALLDHCGLDWNDACLDFHRTDRPVRTASATQVRHPLHGDSLAAWKRYESHLAPMLEGLRKN